MQQTATVPDPRESDKHNPSLRYAVYDGVAWSVMAGAGETYLGAYGIFLRANPFQVGAINSMPALVTAISHMTGVWLMERLKVRRPLCSISSMLQALLWIPILCFGVLFYNEPDTIELLLLCIAAYFFVGALGGPAWGSLVGDIVPARIRGRYFASRSRKIGVSTFISLVTAGQILHLFESWTATAWGFAVIFFIACLARLVSAWWLDKYDDPPFKLEEHDKFTFWDFLRRAPKSNFAKFVFFTACFNFGTAFAGPYFALYMLRELQMGYMRFTAVSAVVTVSQFLTLKHWGALSDRFGNKKVMNITAILISVVPTLWLFSSSLAWIICIQLIAGFVWAGFNLSVSNFVYDAVTPPKRARCLAYSTLINGVFVFSGSMAGGWFVSHPLPYIRDIALFSGAAGAILFVFLLSGLLRASAAIYFLPRFREVRKVEHIRHRHLLFRIATLRPIVGATFSPIMEAPEEKTEEKEEP